MSKIDRVFTHLTIYGSITSLEAFDLYTVTRLADIIFQLKKKGHNIVTGLVPRGNTRYAVYLYSKGKKKNGRTV